MIHSSLSSAFVPGSGSLTLRPATRPNIAVYQALHQRNHPFTRYKYQDRWRTYIKRNPERTSLLGTQPLGPTVCNLLVHEEGLLEGGVLALPHAGAPEDAVADPEAGDLVAGGDDDAAALAAEHDGPGGDDVGACVLRQGLTREEGMWVS